MARVELGGLLVEDWNILIKIPFVTWPSPPPVDGGHLIHAYKANIGFCQSPAPRLAGGGTGGGPFVPTDDSLSCPDPTAVNLLWGRAMG